MKALWIFDFDQDEKPEILFFTQLWQYFLFSKNMFFQQPIGFVEQQHADCHHSSKDHIKHLSL
jgi:hypothetical protein